MNAEVQEPQQTMTFRYGAFDTTIDDKKRLVIPSECRNGIDAERDGKSFFITIGINRRPWFYPEKTYGQLVARNKPMGVTPTWAQLEYYQMTLGNAYQKEPDKQGRLVLPDRLLERAGLADVPIEVTFVGVLDHWEVWPKEAWKLKSDELDMRMTQIVESSQGDGSK
jgi:MraZ protein